MSASSSVQRSDTHTSADQAPRLPRLVLVVDDNRQVREGWALFLAFAGFQVAQAQDAFEAFEQAFSRRPDLIVMDLSLPGLDGWEATRRLKQNALTKHVPIVALTALTDEDAARRAREAGCVSILTKPCQPEALVVEIHRLLDRAPAAA